MGDDKRKDRKKFDWLRFIEGFSQFGAASRDPSWHAKAAEAFVKDIQKREIRMRKNSVPQRSESHSHYQPRRLLNNFPKGLYYSSLSPATLASLEHQEPQPWATISYYEKKKRVGKSFLSKKRKVIVGVVCDIPMDSDVDTFCLGPLSNVDRDRDPNIAFTRENIGRGIRLSSSGDDYSVECLSRSAVFVQSTILNRSSNLKPQTICRVAPGHSLEYFKGSTFVELISELGVKDNKEQLEQMCTIRLSFVKGWGDGYKRPSTLELPCWIEIHLQIPHEELTKSVAKEKAAGNNETTERC